MRKTILTFAMAMACATRALSATVAPVPVAPPVVYPVIQVQQAVRDKLVYQRQAYNYAPAVIHDRGTYHMYWCAGVAGDYIFHAQSTSPTGPFVSSTARLSFMHSPMNSALYDVALAPTRNRSNFDGVHTCDPNVIKINGTFYLYYDGSNDGTMGSAGVAVGSDGVHFTRANNGAPIVTPARTSKTYLANHMTYGSGQPAVFYLAPYVYMAITDTTGTASDPNNGAGQFVLRSTDPTFGSNVQELTATGWAARTFGRHTAEYSILGSFGLDWGYDPASKSVLVATNRLADHTTLLFLDPTTFATIGSGDLPLKWHDGPALLTESDKTLAARANCSNMTTTAYAGAGPSSDPFSWSGIGASTATYSMAAFCNRPKVVTKR